MQWTGLGPMMNVHFRAGPIRTRADAARGNQDLRELFFFDMRERGFYLARRGMAALSLDIGEAESEAFLAVSEFVSVRGGLLS